ncbi:AraC family transcriptional regulator [Puia sp.]|jgi:AraC-like DNA-binding protein/quercetin dioxygenase-like cupin family protein|uniref:helix-turn-helix transcriptional regulator n=1 Tax=Puia sp. TaxID=2045100 RepID=UPI002F3F3582
MDNYFLYFPVGEREGSRGLTVLNTGCTRIEKNSSYPPTAHPSHHNFDWTQGRVLEEYQLIYITHGGGLFESESCREEITAGTVILLQPGERHRYRPHPDSGWDEAWVGFRGELVDHLLRENPFQPGKALFHIGYNETIVNLFNDIHRFSREEKPGYQPVISGVIIYLLGLIHAESRQSRRHAADRVEMMVNKACALFRERVCEKISPEEVAQTLEVSYSLFRKTFKQYMGMAPGQYLIGLRIQKAKELLGEGDRLVKEIAEELSMDALTFCKIFKEKVGMTPVEYRRGMGGR